MTDPTRRRIKASQRQETRGARIMGGQVRPGSGSQTLAKGDVRVPRTDSGSLQQSGVLIEYKRTDGKGLRLTTVMLEKIRGEALLEGRRHLLGFELGRRNFVVFEEDDYIALLEASTGADR